MKLIYRPVVEVKDYRVKLVNVLWRRVLPLSFAYLAGVARGPAAWLWLGMALFCVSTVLLVDG